MTSKYPISVHFTSKDMERSIAFYRDTLGFTLAECWPDPGNPMYAHLTLDGQSVMLGCVPTSEGAAEFGCSPEDAKWVKICAEEMAKNRPGVGVVTYLTVADVDAYYGKVTGNGAKPYRAPRTQFYGLRDFTVEDPDGYRLTFFTPVAMTECQSCGMPLKDAKPGQMYCGYCTDPKGILKPYEAVLEGTVSGYFMGMKKLPRPEAEEAARAHLAKMPAWAGKK